MVARRVPRLLLLLLPPSLRALGVGGPAGAPRGHAPQPQQALYAPFVDTMLGLFDEAGLQLEDYPRNLTIYYGQGDRSDDIYRGMKAFRADCPGGNWYHMTPQAASRAISNMLFGQEDEICEPGIILEEVGE